MPSENQYLSGSSGPPAERIDLRAGPLSMVFEPGGAFLRYVRLGDEEILRGLYSAVRDRNWDTILPVVSDVDIEVDKDAFRIGFDVSCREREVDFGWRGGLTGEPDGTVTYEMEGDARSDFERNRIGFCVLHAPTSVAGRACLVEKVDGSIEEGVYPVLISPHQPFFDMKSISHEVGPGVRATVRFEGDVFEMEDQRNWTDASYKTYCTPLAEPFPVSVRAGDRVEQSVTIGLEREIPEAVTPSRASTVTVSMTEPRPAPAIGVGVASSGDPLTETEVERLRRLHLSHLRVDVHLAGASWERELAEAASQAGVLDVHLEVALFVSDAARVELSSFVRAAKGLRVVRWLLFHVAETTTSEPWLELAREILPQGIPIVAGTNAYFTELNRNRPPEDSCDGVCYSLNPQVHAFDDVSMMETLEAQAWTVESARAFIGDRPLHITPVTLSPRFNPNATGPELELPPGQLPSTVDVRQMSLLGAAWMLGSLASLMAADTASLTYFETVGWRGLMERETGSGSEAFPSLPGGVFPMYHVLAWVGGMRGGEVAQSESNSPLKVQALTLHKEGWIRILLANVTDAAQQVSVSCLELLGTVRVETLDRTSVEQATNDPRGFRGSKDIVEIEPEDGCLQVNLEPYAVACIKGLIA